MSLSLGKMFDRNYNMRIPFLDGFYDIGVFFNKRSTFLLFKADPCFQTSDINTTHGIKINMFKNLESSRFAETFLKLHNYRKTNLDIINQFAAIKDEYYNEINFVFNETLKLAKIEVEDRVLYDTLTLYGFCLTAFNNESLFVIAERQNIVKKLRKKIVRTTGVQICTSRAFKMITEYHEEMQNIQQKEKSSKRVQVPSDQKEVISIDNVGFLKDGDK